MSLESKYAHASRFAEYLRRNGAKVINGSCKLSLTTSALCLLNTLFAEVLNKEWPGSLNISASDAEDIATDIKFLYDFMKRTSFLKLFHCGQTLRGGVDLSQFTSLTVLELRKMPTHLIIGFDCLSAQLKALICSRSIYLFKEIFGSSVNGEPHTWPDLKELNFSYNYLESLDESLKNVPNIEVLDLSHNHIRYTDEIQLLKNLNFVNLSYNELEHLPVFDVASCRSLTKLYLRNNNLENLDGVDCLFNLEELDIGYNLLSDYHVLSRLDKLKILKVLNLEGNPLYFHSRHEMLVLNFINPYALMRGFQLNGVKLSAMQMIPTGSNDTNAMNQTNNHQTSINTVVGDAESLRSIPPPSDFLTRSISEMSEKSSEDASVSSLASQSDMEPLAVGTKDSTKKNSRRKSKSGKYLKKTREVLISEIDYEKSDTVPSTINTAETAVPSYVKTKELMEARREERGVAWLIPDNSFRRISASTPQVPANTPMTSNISPHLISGNDIVSRINSSLGTQNSQSPESDKELASSLPITIESSTAKLVHSPDIVNYILSSSPVEKELKEVLNMNIKTNLPDLGDKLPAENDDIEVLNSRCTEDCIEDHIHASFIKEDTFDGDIYRSDVPSVGYDGELESEEESENSIFFAKIKMNLGKDKFKMQEVSLTVGPNYLKETDAMTGGLIDRLDLNVLQLVRVDFGKKTERNLCELYLEFDTVKSSRQSRVYVFSDPESAKALAAILQPFADAKTLLEVTLGALECVKCGSQFSKQVADKVVVYIRKPDPTKYGAFKEYPVEKDACPNCKNQILVEMESFPLPSTAVPSNMSIPSTKKESDKSPDSASIGSGSPSQIFSTLFSSMKISPILKKKPAPKVENNEGMEESGATNMNIDTQKQNPCLKSSENDCTLRRNSSDVTIISNPSQSSIAVIPDPELNLNTITERDSQSSISPPISQDSIYYKAHNASESEETVEASVSGVPNVINQIDKTCSTNGADNDFFSINDESSANESASHFLANEAVSSGSEHYMSPFKSAGSNKSKSDSPIEIKEVDDVSHLLNILGEKQTITYDMFSEIDHRLKLHLEINVFADHEQLEACLQTAIVPLSTGDEFAGLFAISSEKMYIIKFLPLYNLSLNQSEPIEKVIQIVHSCSISQLKQTKIILGSQGLTLSCGPNSQVYTLIIRDADICNSFLGLLADFLQQHHQEGVTVEFLTAVDETMQLLKESVFSTCVESSETPEILLHLFAFWWNSRAGEKNSNIPVCVIITPEDIFISRILYKKQISSPDLRKLNVYHYSLVDHQKLSDLVSLKLKKDLRSVEISFLNEQSSQQNCDSVFWTIKMETKSALFSFICALKTPWEEIFGIPLSLTCEEE